MGNDTRKSEFLAIGKWACKEAKVKLVFDNDQGAWVDIEKRVIHMPKRIAVADMPVWIATIVHEAMHIKHTPKWLSDIPRDKVDKLIMNALEDERIERHACRQLRAFPHILNKMTQYVVRNISRADYANPKNYPMQVLCNLAAKNSGSTPFTSCRGLERLCEPIIKTLRKRHEDVIERVTPTAFKGHVTEYYKELDQLKKLLQIPEPEKEKGIPKEGKGGKDGGEEGEKGEGCKSKPSQDGQKSGDGNAMKEMLKQAGKDEMGNNAVGKTSSPGPSENIDMEGMAVTQFSVPLENTVRDRIKAALKRSLLTSNVEGNTLDTSELVSFMAGTIDDLFYETKTEKRMKTKVYFLMDTSGSMGCHDIYSTKGGTQMRLNVAHGAFKSIEEVVAELKAEDGCDIEHDSYVFADKCEKWDGKEMNKIPWVGGGTQFFAAMNKVMSDIAKDDPANKRILIVITDGDVYDHDIEDTKKLMQSSGQDIRVVFVSIGDCNKEFFKHKITSTETANVAVFESFEEAIDG